MMASLSEEQQHIYIYYIIHLHRHTARVISSDKDTRQSHMSALSVSAHTLQSARSNSVFRRPGRLLIDVISCVHSNGLSGASCDPFETH